MSHLLAPGDERDLAAFLCETLGAELLLSDLATAGKPHLADDAPAALPKALPGPAAFGDRAVRTLIFWLPRVGPIRTLTDAPPPQASRDSVARHLSAAAAGSRAGDLIDLERTPVLILNRSKALSPKRLAPGRLAAMPLPTAALPPEVRAAHARACRWLTARALKVDPFDYCPEVQHRRPKFRCWIQPEALRMVQGGAEIWPYG